MKLTPGKILFHRPEEWHWNTKSSDISESTALECQDTIMKCDLSLGLEGVLLVVPLASVRLILPSPLFRPQFVNAGKKVYFLNHFNVGALV
jgi:hypothetical protein